MDYREIRYTREGGARPTRGNGMTVVIFASG